jgi:hypothetical protein
MEISLGCVTSVSKTSKVGKSDQKLYQRRAKKLTDYLIAKGIKKNRISVKSSFFVYSAARFKRNLRLLS